MTVAPSDQTEARSAAQPASETAPKGSIVFSLIRLARPAQWVKSGFVLIGPLYGLREMPADRIIPAILSVVLTTVAFSLASSACYVVNDLADREADRAHPRKRHRPIASGRVSIRLARMYALALFFVAGLLVLAIPTNAAIWVGVCLAIYVLNVTAYTVVLKHVVIADVMSLALGFVLRVMAGCAAALIDPSTWLLNVTFFLSMFLAFGKRLGERRTLGSGGSEPGDPEAHSRTIRHRRVQEGYTDSILQMSVVVTAVTTLMTYAFYVQDQAARHQYGFNLLWLTVLPATYGLLRAIVLIERGRYDDPTELAIHDRPFQAAGIIFVLLTIALLLAQSHPG